MSAKSDLLALVQLQSEQLLAAVSALPEEGLDPLQALLDAANQKVAVLQAQIDKASADVKAVEADLAPVVA